MILERAGNSPVLAAFCLPLSTDLKVFNDFNDFNDFNNPFSPNVLFPLKKNSAQTSRACADKTEPRQKSYSVSTFS